MRKVISLSFVLSGIILGNITEEQFFYQDYMDFGQNRGRYTAGTQGVTITQRKYDPTTKKYATVYGDYSTNPEQSKFFDVKMPDFSGPVDRTFSNLTAIGGSYIASVWHVTELPGVTYFSGPDFRYDFVEKQTTGNQTTDRSLVRLNKFYTGATAEVIEVSKGKPLDAKRYTHFWRAGQGDMYYTNNKTIKNGIHKIGYGFPGNYKTGGIIEYINTGNNKINFHVKASTFFSNFITKGDSGSPLFAWDSYEKKWVVVGFASSSTIYTNGNPVTSHNTQFTFFYQSELQTLKDKYTNGTLALDGKTLEWNGSQLGTLTTIKEKDTYLTGGGTINLTTAVDSGSGGFYFQGSKGTTYTVTGTYTNSKKQHVAFQWKGGGISIDEGVLVNWNINGYSASDGLFKIGKGTLRVTQENISWLDLGDGTVILDTDNKTFSRIVMVSGRATLKLGTGKSKALDTSKLNFSKDGGRLDINGNNLTFDRIHASDIGARIINTGDNATITITNTSSGDYAYHGQIASGINLVTTQASDTQSIIFDGSINAPSNTLENKKGITAFQGHPIIHAYFSLKQGSPYYLVQQSLPQEVFTTPTKVDQKDWEHRVFVLDSIKIDGNNTDHPTLTLAQHATLLSDIYAIQGNIKFGDVKVYADAKDGENALGNNGNFNQNLTNRTSDKDNYFFEGNITLKSNSSLSVDNTEKNPIKFGSFLGTDKGNGTSNELKEKMLNYNLALDDTSSASIKYLDLYAANISALSSTKDASTPSISPSNPSKGTITVENLNIHTGISRINGSGKLELKTNSTNSKIIFDNLDSILVLNNQNTLMLDSTTKITLNKISNVDNYKALKYNADYILIKSDEKISDNRSDKNINVISHNLADFIKIDSIHKDHEIGIKLVRTTPIDLNEASWMDKWLDKTITPSTSSSSTSTQLNNIKEAVGKYEDIFRALAQTNINGKKVYEDVYLDKIVDDAANGNRAALSKHLEDINNAIKSMDEYRSSTVESMLNSFSAYTYQKDARENILRQSGFNMRTSSLLKQILNTHLAQNEQDKTSDIKSDARPMDMIASLISSNKHHAWADAQGLFFGGEGKMAYAAGLSAGYDYYILNQKDKFLSLGLSLRYNFAGARAYDVQSQLQNLIGALHSQYITGHNEMLFNLYLGGSIARLTSSSRTSNDMSIRIDGYYKYRFDLTKGNNYYQAIKPVVGIGYSYVYLPQEIFNAFDNDDFIKIASMNQNIPFIRAGAEYNLATQHSINAISLLATYNAISHFSRQVYIGTANPIGYDTTISPIWLELAFSGNYDLTDSFSLKYMIATQYIPTASFGVSGSIGGSWHF